MFVLPCTRASGFPHFRGLSRAHYSFSLAPGLGFLPVEMKGTACACLVPIAVRSHHVVRAYTPLWAFISTSASNRLDVAWNISWRNLFPWNPKSHPFNCGSQACIICQKPVPFTAPPQALHKCALHKLLHQSVFTLLT